jgi:hypothetical protein
MKEKQKDRKAWGDEGNKLCCACKRSYVADV